MKQYQQMEKSILIIGAGTGLSAGVAKKFGSEGYRIALISRDEANLANLKRQISVTGFHVDYEVADVENTQQLNRVIRNLASVTGGFDVVLYNAAVVKKKDILDETAELLTTEFSVNVANVIVSLQVAYPGLKEKAGSLLLTGCGLGIIPDTNYGSLSIGKAGLRSLAYQLHDRLKNDGIYVGLLTVSGNINPESKTHSPFALANLFWKLHHDRSAVEIHQ